ncbi:MAG: Sb-PDE family phosphodiesterase [Bacteroidota bacterium]
MKKFFFFVLIALISTVAFGQQYQEAGADSAHFQIPDIPGYHTLKCDFHMHTVFSDGVVWPHVRVDEAIAEGLDVISITDHVEYHRKEVEDNHMVPYEIAKKHAEGTALILILGGEISASKDHFNALFLKNTDEPTLRDKIPANRIAAANEQGAFVFWNHPGWTAKYKDGNTPRDEVFIELMKSGQIKGIEVCNGPGYWEGAHDLVEEFNLTLIGNSDIHGVSTYQYQPDKHRTITLVFAREKSVEGVQEALLNHRTAIYQGDHLIGAEDLLKPLFFESLDIETEYREGTSVAIMSITNNSDFDFICENQGPYNFYSGINFFTIKAHAKTIIYVKTLEKLSGFSLDLLVHNALVAPGQKMELAIEVKDL